MKIYLELTEEQKKYLQSFPDFNLQNWFSQIFDKKINDIKNKNGNITVIITAAGYDARISGIVTDVPKAMLTIKGKSLLARQIEILNKFNLRDIIVIRGYKKENITIPGVKYFDNDEYETTGILHSFFLASDKIKGKTILLYGDILFEKDVLEGLIHNTSDFVVVVDKLWREHYRNRIQHTISEAELVQVEDSFVTHMGCDIPYQDAYGEFIGLAAFSPDGAEKAKKIYKKIKKSSNQQMELTPSMRNASLTDFFNVLIARGEKIATVDIHGGWFEIDTFEDYRKSWSMVS